MQPASLSPPKCVPEWTAQDQETAMAQGWAIFAVSGRDPERENRLVNGKPYGRRPYELQALDEAEVFVDDEAAWAFVRARWAEGDPLACKAADWLKARSPAEHAAVFG